MCVVLSEGAIEGALNVDSLLEVRLEATCPRISYINFNDGVQRLG